MLDIEDLHVNIGDKEVLHGINLHIDARRDPCAHGPQWLR